MNIDYPPPERINHILRNQPQKPGQNHKVGLPATKHHQHLSGLIKLGPVEKKCIHPECRSPFQNLSLRLVRQNEGHLRIFIVRKVPDDVFSIGTISGGKYGYMLHFLLFRLYFLTG